MKKWLHILVMVASLGLFLNGCSTFQRTNYKIDGITFYSKVPASVSTVWEDGINTFIVLKRGQTITSAFDANGVELPIIVFGSYLKLSGLHSRIVLRVGDDNQSAYK